jgi:hypothetical protein
MTDITPHDLKGRDVLPAPLRAALGAITRANTGAASTYITRYRAAHSDATPRDVLDALEHRYWILSSMAGGSVGALAALPGIGTGTALATSTLEQVGFLEATAFYIVARAELHGLPVDDQLRRQTLFMTILLGDAGYATLTQIAGRTGKHWGAAVTKTIPMSTIRAANSVLGRNVITKYGTKQGVIVIGRALPFGIGAVIGGTAGALSARAIMAAADKAFGDPPSGFSPSSAPQGPVEPGLPPVAAAA